LRRVERCLGGKLKERRVMREGDIKGGGKSRGLVLWRRVKIERKNLSEDAEGRRKGKIERRREGSVPRQLHG